VHLCHEPAPQAAPVRPRSAAADTAHDASAAATFRAFATVGQFPAARAAIADVFRRARRARPGFVAGIEFRIGSVIHGCSRLVRVGRSRFYVRRAPRGALHALH